MTPGNVVTVLDVGSSKVCCCIANVDKNGNIDIKSVGYCSCSGVKSGVIVDMESVEKSIVKSVEIAEKAADFRVKSVYINISGKSVKSRIVRASMNLGERLITQEDVDRLLTSFDFETSDYEIIHAIPISFTVDSMQGIKDPVGMFATRLEAAINVVTAPRSQLNNVILCAIKYHLEPIGIVASSYASGLCMYDENDSRPQIVVDFGAGTTSISFFYNGIFCGCETIPIGGKHITNDIAYGANVSALTAERIKTLHGAAFVSIDDVRDTIFVPEMEDDIVIDLQQLPKSTLNNIIQSRAEEIVKIVKKKIEASIFKKDFKASSVTITGGGSQLTGMRELTSLILCKKVKVRKLSSAASENFNIENDFATALGMIRFAQKTDKDLSFNESKKKDGFLKKTLLWIENNL